MSAPEAAPGTIPPRAAAERRAALVLSVAAALALLVASPLGAFRADDWINLEQGARAWSSAWRETWTTLNPFTLHRPLVDVWHGLMLRAFGLRPWPHLVALIALLALHTWLLARIVRLRSEAPPALASAAAWAQANAWAWTALWVSNATGSLMATFWLLAMLAHHAAVARAGSGRTAAPIALAVACVPIAGLCKEEAVLLPAVLAVMEAARWGRLSPAARRTARISIAAIGLAAALYAAYRLLALPRPPGGGGYYGLALGPHVLSNLAFFALHLGALPATALIVARALFPAAFRRAAWRGPAFAAARREALAGLGWAVVGIALYLPIGGRGYGYLYLPAFGVALAVGGALAWAAAVEREARGRAPLAATALAAHAVLAFALTGAGLALSHWPRYRALQAEAFAVVDRALPDPPRGAEIVFLDPREGESLAGRSLFDLLFDDATGSMMRVRLGRPDLTARVVAGPAALAAVDDPPEAAAVFLAREGRLTPVAVQGARARAVRDTARARP